MALPDEDLNRLRIDRGDKAAGFRPARRGRRLLWPVLAVVVVVGGALAYFIWTPAVTVETATITTAYPSQAYTLLNATGYVVAQRKAAVGSKATGRLEWLGVAEGSPVKQGEVIARIESGDVSASLAQARANVNVARASLAQAEAEFRDAEQALKRSQELLAKGFVSQGAHDSAIARYEQAVAARRGGRAGIGAAEAAERGAAVALEQTLIRAPFDGVVLTKTADMGDVITPFSSAVDTKGAVVTMADMATLEVEADVSEANLQKVRVGQPCEIQLDALPDKRFRGAVNRMVPTVDRAKATVLVKVSFLDRDSRILPEMSAKIAFLSAELPPDERTPRVVVQPAAAVVRGGKQVVFVVELDRARMRDIVTGRKLGDAVEVVRGLKPGERVVVKPPDKLGDGDAVKVAVQ
jgi:RND family efflux transporter MFP subunit